MRERTRVKKEIVRNREKNERERERENQIEVGER